MHLQFRPLQLLAVQLQAVTNNRSKSLPLFLLNWESLQLPTTTKRPTRHLALLKVTWNQRMQGSKSKERARSVWTMKSGWFSFHVVISVLVFSVLPHWKTALYVGQIFKALFEPFFRENLWKEISNVTSVPASNPFRAGTLLLNRLTPTNWPKLIGGYYPLVTRLP